MFAILTPALATPILMVLYVGTRDSSKRLDMETALEKDSDHKTSVEADSTVKEKALHIFWQLDVVGLVLLVVGIGLVLVTVTIANGRVAKWSDCPSAFPSGHSDES